MSTARTLNERIIEVLKANSEVRFTAREIAKELIDRFPDAMRKKQMRSAQDLSDENIFINQIVAEIGSNRPAIEKRWSENFRFTADRPRKFYWTGNTEPHEQNTLPTKSKASPVSEHDLYPILQTYLEQDLGVFSMRIDEKRSSNRRGSGGNRWLYPDLVGIENIAANWDREIVETAKIFSDSRANFYSFEVKLQLSLSNVRESYFQAVSNSSWANFGYLVAAEIEGDDTASELRMLFGLHGIGVIQLNADDTSDSQIIIPARQRNTVDWATCNRLLSENTDFEDFIIRSRGYYQTSRFEPFRR